MTNRMMFSILEVIYINKCYFDDIFKHFLTHKEKEINEKN